MFENSEPLMLPNIRDRALEEPEDLNESVNGFSRSKLYILPPLTKTKNELNEYFKVFGEIEDISIVLDQKDYHSYVGYKTRCCSAYIHFKSTESVSKAIMNCEALQAKDIYMKVAYNLSDQIELEGGQLDSKLQIQEGGLISGLNDYCLLKIFEDLSLSDQMKMSNISSRFDNILRMIYQKTLTINVQQISIFDFRDALQICGYQLVEINIITYYKKNLSHYAYLISVFCPNLQKLQCNSLGYIYCRTFHDIMGRLTNLRHLEVRDTAVIDSMVKSITNLQDLKHLDLSHNKAVTGLHFDKFINLRVLLINNCYALEPSNFIKMSLNTSGLMELQLLNCDQITNNCIEAIVENLQNLEKLVIQIEWNTSEIKKISKLKLLKHLEVHENTYSGDYLKELLISLSNDKYDSLESLCIFKYKLPYKNDEEVCIGKLLNLKLLELKGYRDQTTPKSYMNYLNLKNLNILRIPQTKIKPIELLTSLRKWIDIKEIDMYISTDFNVTYLQEIVRMLQEENRAQKIIIHNQSFESEIESFVVSKDGARIFSTYPLEVRFSLMRKFHNSAIIG